MGDAYASGAEEGAGYGERVLAQLAGAALRLATEGEGPQHEALVAEARVRGGRLGSRGLGAWGPAARGLVARGVGAVGAGGAGLGAGARRGGEAQWLGGPAQH